MRISIIIPVYNGERYLPQIIEAIQKQSYKNIELILVNDGSQDRSLDICKRFQSSDDRIIVIDKCNQGISAARNTGLEAASGDYISFIDQDDEISDNIYEELVAGYNSDVDWVIGGKIMQLVDSDGRIKNCTEYRYTEEVIDSRQKVLKKVYNFSRDACMLHLWNCLYKASVIQEYGIRFHENLKYGHEDSLFNVEYASKCTKVHVIPGMVYKYYRREGTSTSLRANSGYLQDFTLYAETVGKCFRPLDSDKIARDYTYTYLLRLGASLFCQYSQGLEMSGRKRDLQCIYRICRDTAGSGKVRFAKKTKKDFLVECLYTVFSGLLRNGMYGLSIMLIDRIKG